MPGQLVHAVPTIQRPAVQVSEGIEASHFKQLSFKPPPLAILQMCERRQAGMAALVTSELSTNSSTAKQPQQRPQC